MKKTISFIFITLGFILIVLSLILTSSSNKNNSSKTPDEIVPEEKKIEFDFNGWHFVLPEGWKEGDPNKDGKHILFENTVDGNTYSNGALFNIVYSRTTKYLNDELFKDTTIFKDRISKNTYIALEDEGRIIEHKNKPVMVFPFHYIEDESSKIIRALTPADDLYYFDFKFYSNRDVDDHDEMFFNYDDLLLFVDFLNTGVKKQS